MGMGAQRRGTETVFACLEHPSLGLCEVVPVSAAKGSQANRMDEAVLAHVVDGRLRVHPAIDLARRRALTYRFVPNILMRSEVGEGFGWRRGDLQEWLGLGES